MTPRPSIPDPPHAGGCLCGAVRFHIAARPLAINACHCTDCKRASGGTHAVFIHVETPALARESGDLAAYRKRADSGRDIDIMRCAQCATRLWHAPTSSPNLRFVCAGVLDDPSWCVPTSHIYLARRDPHATVEADAIQFDLGAPDRQMLWDRFAEIYGAA